MTGNTFLQTLGFDSTATTRDIIVLDCMYAGFVLLALALFWLRLPRTSQAPNPLVRLAHRLCCRRTISQ